MSTAWRLAIRSRAVRKRHTAICHNENQNWIQVVAKSALSESMILHLRMTHSKGRSLETADF
jgi:hypothetical protein